MIPYYIQIFNQEDDPVYIDLESGEAFWVIPNGTNFSNILFLTHLSENSTPYYENVTTGEVAWSLPPEEVMSVYARNTAERLQSSNRQETEDFLETSYNENLAESLIHSLDSYLESLEAPDSYNASSTWTYTEPDNSYKTIKDTSESGGRVSSEEMNTGSSSEYEGQIQSEKSLKLETPGKSMSGKKSVLEIDVQVTEPKTIESMKSNVIKSGYLMKLAKVSGRNWRKRYFVLKPYNFAYYADEKPNQKPKGEFRFTGDTVIEEEKIDKKIGFGFKISNSQDAVSLAAPTENSRTQWMKFLKSIVGYSAHFLSTHLSILPQTETKTGGFFSRSSKTQIEKKFFILSHQLLTWHPSEAATTEVEGVMNLMAGRTLIDDYDDDELLFTLTERLPSQPLSENDKNKKRKSAPTPQDLKITLRFDQGTAEDQNQEEYRRWKQAIMKMINGETNYLEGASGESITPCLPSTPAVLRDVNDSPGGLNKNGRRGSITTSTPPPPSSTNSPTPGISRGASFGALSPKSTKNETMTSAVNDLASINPFLAAMDDDDDDDAFPVLSPLSPAPSDPRYQLELEGLPTEVTDTPLNRFNGPPSPAVQPKSPVVDTGGKNALQRAGERRQKKSGGSKTSNSSIGSGTNSSAAGASGGVSSGSQVPKALQSLHKFMEDEEPGTPASPPPLPPSLPPPPAPSFEESLGVLRNSNLQMSEALTFIPALTNIGSPVVKQPNPPLQSISNTKPTVPSTLPASPPITPPPGAPPVPPPSVTHSSSLPPPPMPPSQPPAVRPLMPNGDSPVPPPPPTSSLTTAEEEEAKRRVRRGELALSVATVKPFSFIGDPDSVPSYPRETPPTVVDPNTTMSSPPPPPNQPPPVPRLEKVNEYNSAPPPPPSDSFVPLSTGSPQLNQHNLSGYENESEGSADRATRRPSAANALDISASRKAKKKASRGSFSKGRGRTRSIRANSGSESEATAGSSGMKSALELFKRHTKSSRPAAQVMFENYCTLTTVSTISPLGEKTSVEVGSIDAVALQMMCYDFGAFYPLEQLRAEVAQYASKNNTRCDGLEYQDFLRWSSSQDFFKSLRFNDPVVERRLAAAEKFKIKDPNLTGFVSRLDIGDIVKELVEARFLTKKASTSLKSVMIKMDPTYRGKVDLLSFIQWIDSSELPSSARKSTLRKIFGSFAQQTLQESTSSSLGSRPAESTHPDTIVENDRDSVLTTDDFDLNFAPDPANAFSEGDKRVGQEQENQEIFSPPPPLPLVEVQVEENTAIFGLLAAELESDDDDAAWATTKTSDTIPQLHNTEKTNTTASANPMFGEKKEPRVPIEPTVSFSDQGSVQVSNPLPRSYTEVTHEQSAAGTVELPSVQVNPSAKLTQNPVEPTRESSYTRGFWAALDTAADLNEATSPLTPLSGISGSPSPGGVQRGVSGQVSFSKIYGSDSVDGGDGSGSRKLEVGSGELNALQRSALRKAQKDLRKQSVSMPSRQTTSKGSATAPTLHSQNSQQSLEEGIDLSAIGVFGINMNSDSDEDEKTSESAIKPFQSPAPPAPKPTEIPSDTPSSSAENPEKEGKRPVTKKKKNPRFRRSSLTTMTARTNSTAFAPGTVVPIEENDFKAEKTSSHAPPTETSLKPTPVEGKMEYGNPLMAKLQKSALNTQKTLSSNTVENVNPLKSAVTSASSSELNREISRKVDISVETTTFVSPIQNTSSQQNPPNEPTSSSVTHPTTTFSEHRVSNIPNEEQNGGEAKKRAFSPGHTRPTTRFNPDTYTNLLEQVEHPLKTDAATQVPFSPQPTRPSREVSIRAQESSSSEYQPSSPISSPNRKPRKDISTSYFLDEETIEPMTPVVSDTINQSSGNINITSEPQNTCSQNDTNKSLQGSQEVAQALAELERQREEMKALLEGLETAKTESLKKLEEAEAVSLKRIQEESERSLEGVKQAERDLLKKTEEQRVEQEKLLDSFRKQQETFQQEQERGKQEHRQRLEVLTELATSLSKHHEHVMQERRRVGQLRYGLEVTLRQLNDKGGQNNGLSSPNQHFSPSSSAFPETQEASPDAQTLGTKNLGQQHTYPPLHHGGRRVPPGMDPTFYTTPGQANAQSSFEPTPMRRGYPSPTEENQFQTPHEGQTLFPNGTMNGLYLHPRNEGPEFIHALKKFNANTAQIRNGIVPNHTPQGMLEAFGKLDPTVSAAHIRARPYNPIPGYPGAPDNGRKRGQRPISPGVGRVPAGRQQEGGYPVDVLGRPLVARNRSPQGYSVKKPFR